MSLNNSSDTIGNRTGELAASAPQRTPAVRSWPIVVFIIIIIIVLFLNLQTN
jgi:hypothetical protein